MAKLELFTRDEYKQPDLTEEDKEYLIQKLIYQANYRMQYLYGVYETANMLRLTIDQMQGLIYSYKLDCTSIRTALRFPWWSICEYLIDPAEDVDKAVAEYIRSLPQKQMQIA